MAKAKPANVDEYIDDAPEVAQERLREIRALLRSVAPDATEAIKWNVPALETDRILFAYSAHKIHINFTPTRSTLEAMKDELSDFETGRDNIKLPYDRPLPLDLLRRVAEYRVNEVQDGAKWRNSD